MSYANAVASPADRARAAATVIGIHGLLGAGLVLGLAVTTLVPEKEGEIITEFIDDEVLPPPPPPIEETVEDPPAYVPPAAPRPPVPLNTDIPINVVDATDDVPPITNVIPTVIPTPGPVVVETPAPPTPVFTPTAPVPANQTNSWITTDDYSRSDLIRNREGTASYRLVIGTDGRVDACEITVSTGHDTLDRNTCRLIERRARFDPATNNRGEDVVGTYTGRVTWRIPE